MLLVNRTLAEMQEYASKAISVAAKADPCVLNLSIGEPAFGPPNDILDAIAKDDLSLSAFMLGAKHYETTRGSKDLRQAISLWYARRYGLMVDPDREILITHGGVEAVALALLSTTEPGDAVGVTDPSYMLYKRAAMTLGRQIRIFPRQPCTHEFVDLQSNEAINCIRTFIVNSPENPSGYVLSDRDWEALADVTESANAWVIHDEVYDAFDFGRPHRPAWNNERLRERTVMINSFSKKFGVPGLRIGWLVAPERIIELAGKAHDYLVLGVNAQYERIALRLLANPQVDSWLGSIRDLIKSRVNRVTVQLTGSRFEWSRQPLGGMFGFPSTRQLYDRLPPFWREQHVSRGEAVAAFLLKEHGVAVVPGAVYGDSVADHIRLVLCTSEETFDEALNRLSVATTR